MKITLELKETTIPPNEVHKTETWVGNNIGLYLVNDGIAFILVYWNGNYSTILPIPNKEVINELVRVNRKDAEEYVDKTARDFNSEILNQLEFLTQGVKFLTEKEATTPYVEQPRNNGSNIDIKDITQLIAVAQKPELIKE